MRVDFPEEDGVDGQRGREGAEGDQARLLSGEGGLRGGPGVARAGVAERGRTFESEAGGGVRHEPVRLANQRSQPV